jgi:diguanylate cyclase (GGDEF)-like protein
MDVVFSFSAIAQMVNGVVATMALVWIDVRMMQAELSRVADSDPLTGLPNRRAAMNRFAEEAARAARNGQRFGLAVLDIDHFKRINDRHGHVAGDAVLNEVGRALRLAKRGDDALGRLGGEEFVLILPQQAREGAAEAAQRLREAVARAAVVVGGETVRVTVSGGIAIYPEDGETWDALFAVADRRLYDAKREGRDRITVTG